MLHYCSLCTLNRVKWGGEGGVFNVLEAIGLIQKWQRTLVGYNIYILGVSKAYSFLIVMSWLIKDTHHK